MNEQLSLLSENTEVPPRKVLTVTELTRRIKQSLESGFSSVSVEGEISNFRFHTSGHMYFALKDSGATLSAVVWRSKAQTLAFQPEDGMRVIATGRLSVYEVRGAYQLDVSSLRLSGVGELQLAFERLKRKLSEEGLFDAEHKRPLPEFPQKIGIVTSPTGAALQDMLHVLRRRFPDVEVIVAPCAVQGSGAANEVAEALDNLNEFGGVDVIVVARGGGSLEDLWAFNEEMVARAIYRSKIPVISAVGHEIDFTIADFVADMRAPTPSAAAEMAVRNRFVLLETVCDYWYHIQEEVVGIVDSRKDRIKNLLRSYSFNKPVDTLRQFGQRIDELERALRSALAHKLSIVRGHADSLRNQLQALDPTSVLKRGYAIVRRDNLVVGSVSQLRPNDQIEIAFHDGHVTSKVLR